MDFLHWPIWFTLTIIFAFVGPWGYGRAIEKIKTKTMILEAKVKYLYEKTGVIYDPTPELPPAIYEAAVAGEKIKAIKLYREATGKGLLESKAAVERMVS